MWFLSLLNPIGKVIDVVGAYVNKRQDVDLEKYKVKGGIDVEAMKQDTAIIQARVDLAKARAGDPVDAVARMLMSWSMGVLVAINCYWLAFANTFPEWILVEPKPMEGDIKYLFMAVVAYLFVNAWKKA